MKATLGILLVLLLAIMQIVASDRFRLLGTGPDLLLLAAIGVALHASPRRAMAAAWAIGLLKGLGGAAPLGIDALIFTLVAVSFLLLRRVLYTGHPVTQLLLVFVFAFLGNLLFVAEMLFAQGARMPTGFILEHSAFAGLYTALLAPFILTAWRLLLSKEMRAMEQMGVGHA